MLEWEYLLLLGGVGLVVLLWRAQLRAWEMARAAVSRRCKKLGVQLLDDTVVLRRIRVGRDKSGVWRFYRIYDFEYSEDGVHRLSGRLVMVGRFIQAVQMGDDLVPP